MSRMGYLLARITESIRREGARATAGRVLRELVDRVSPPRQCLFWMPLASHDRAASHDGVCLQVVSQFLDAQLLGLLEARLGKSTTTVFRERLARGCSLCVLLGGEELVGTLFFVFGRVHPFQHVVVTEGDAVILDAWVDPRFRGRGLYSVFLDLALGSLHGQGVERVFVATSERNEPSLRALRRVGFRYLLRYRVRRAHYDYDVDPL